MDLHEQMKTEIGRRRIVKETWDELGFKLRAPRYLVWVRTMPPARKIGRIWLPAKQASFYGELPHMVTVKALVLSAGSRGPAREMKPGDMIAFKRLHFARHSRLESSYADVWGGSEDYVGWIDSNDIVGFAEERDVRAIPESVDGVATAAL